MAKKICMTQAEKSLLTDLLNDVLEENEGYEEEEREEGNLESASKYKKYRVKIERVMKKIEEIPNC